jgi:hypothetical protein
VLCSISFPQYNYIKVVGKTAPHFFITICAAAVAAEWRFFMKRSIAIIISIMFVLAITFPAVAVSTIVVKSIKLNISKITLKVGQTSNLKVTFTPVNTSQKN